MMMKAGVPMSDTPANNKLSYNDYNTLLEEYIQLDNELQELYRKYRDLHDFLKRKLTKTGKIRRYPNRRKKRLPDPPRIRKPFRRRGTCRLLPEGWTPSFRHEPVQRHVLPTVDRLISDPSQFYEPEPWTPLSDLPEPYNDPEWVTEHVVNPVTQEIGVTVTGDMLHGVYPDMSGLTGIIEAVQETWTRLCAGDNVMTSPFGVGRHVEDIYKGCLTLLTNGNFRVAVNDDPYGTGVGTIIEDTVSFANTVQPGIEHYLEQQSSVLTPDQFINYYNTVLYEIFSKRLTWIDEVNGGEYFDHGDSPLEGIEPGYEGVLNDYRTFNERNRYRMLTTRDEM